MCLALVTLLLAVGWLSARVMFLLPYESPAHITQPAPVMEGQGFSKLFGRAACKSSTWYLGIVNLVINAIFLKCHGVGSWCVWNMQIQLALTKHSVPGCEEKLQILTSLGIGGTEFGRLRHTYFDLIHF